MVDSYSTLYPDSFARKSSHLFDFCFFTKALNKSVNDNHHQKALSCDNFHQHPVYKTPGLYSRYVCWILSCVCTRLLSRGEGSQWPWTARRLVSSRCQESCPVVKCSIHSNSRALFCWNDWPQTQTFSDIQLISLMKHYISRFLFVIEVYDNFLMRDRKDSCLEFLDTIRLFTSSLFRACLHGGRLPRLTHI